MTRQKVTTFLWFDCQAEEAASFYVSLFDNSGIDRVTARPDGVVQIVEFHLSGTQFLAMNGGPQFKFTEAISLSVDCQDQAEIDQLWEQLTAGGTPGQCGWLKDRFGLSWQIVPSCLSTLMSDPDPARVQRVVAALMQMTRIEIAKLMSASAGETRHG